MYNPSDYEEDSPSWTHETLVIVESIGLTASTITVVPVTIASIAGVEGAGDGVLVSLHHIVLWTPDVVTVVSIAVVVSISRIVARHVNKVRGSIAVTGNIAQVKLNTLEKKSRSYKSYIRIYRQKRPPQIKKTGSVLLPLIGL